MEMENKLTVIRGEGGIMGERRGRGKSRNINRRLMGTHNEWGLTGVRGGAWGRGEQGGGVLGERWGNCN